MSNKAGRLAKLERTVDQTHPHYSGSDGVTDAEVEAILDIYETMGALSETAIAQALEDYRADRNQSPAGLTQILGELCSKE